MIKFDDGTEITWEEAARMIEAEGLIYQTKGYGDEFGRCSLGVLQGWTPDYHLDRLLPIGGPGRDIVEASETFEGTPEERCVYMAAWLRARGNVEA